MEGRCTVGSLCAWLEEQFPPELAADWDNVGLLLGDRQAPVQRVMTCLTLTAESVAEAVRERAQLVIAHHPLPFRPVRRITADSPAGRLIWQLAGAGIAVYSPHTALDSARWGINQQIAEGLGLQEIRPLVEPLRAPGDAGTGRRGGLETPVPQHVLADRLARLFPGAQIRWSAGPVADCHQVAIVCGSGGSLLDAAMAAGADTFITGEATFHQCLEARAGGMSLFLVGHYHSERFAVERLAERIATAFPDCAFWASRDEADPLTIL